MSGNWYKFTVPVPLRIEIFLIDNIRNIKDDLGNVVSSVVSEVLDLPPDIIDEDLTGDQVFKIFELVFPNIDSSVSQKVQSVQSEFENKGTSLNDSFLKMIAFLARYGNIQPSEALGLPRAIIEKIFRELIELLEVDKKMEMELSAVHALSMMFGGKGVSQSSSSSSAFMGDGSIDLMSIDPSDLSKLGKLDNVEVR